MKIIFSTLTMISNFLVESMRSFLTLIDNTYYYLFNWIYLAN